MVVGTRAARNRQRSRNVSYSSSTGTAAGVGTLAFTGTNSLTLAGVAIAAVFAGLAFLRVSKKLSS
jgi:hypothetical protein